MELSGQPISQSISDPVWKTGERVKEDADFPHLASCVPHPNPVPNMHTLFFLKWRPNLWEQLVSYWATWTERLGNLGVGDTHKYWKQDI